MLDKLKCRRTFFVDPRDNHPLPFNQYGFYGHPNQEIVIIMINPSKRIEVPISTRCIFTPAELGSCPAVFFGTNNRLGAWTLANLYSLPTTLPATSGKGSMNFTLKELMMMMIRNDDQEWWSGMMIRNDDQEWWSGMMIRNDDQEWWSGMMIRNDDQEWWSGMMIRNYNNTILEVFVKDHLPKRCMQLFKKKVSNSGALQICLNFHSKSPGILCIFILF